MVIIMKILIVRHADPDYSIDSLTPQGKLEAELLSQRLSKLNVKEFYVSPLGRAKDTAAYTLSKLNRTAIECDWLKEFPCVINRPDKDNIIAWDWLPADWTSIKEFYSMDDWTNVSAMSDGNVLSEFKYVTEEFDKILANHGYLRHQKLYKTITPNEDTIILFCHFGVECVLLGHLLGISPMLLWHGFCAAPSSVTTIVSEERRQGIVYFRVSGFGDISHLYSAGEEPSFAARFCETYYNSTQRHD